MKKLSKFITDRVFVSIAQAALFMGVHSTSQACFLAFNQPEVPEDIKKFKK